MNRKIRSGIFALFAAIFALAVVSMPIKAWALDTTENFEVYSDPSRDIYILMENGHGVFDNTVNVDVYVDGELVGEKTVEDVPSSDVHFEVNAPFYRIEVNGDGSISSGGNGRFYIQYAAGGERSLRVDLTSTRGSYDIVNPETDESYGTFSWAKSDASNTSYERTLNVEVDGQRVYQTTVRTPELLLNTEAQDEYWFTPDTSQFSADVEVSPDTLDTAANKDVTVRLTTKSGSESTENTWVTPYGTVGYMPREDGYRMKVELYVNNEKVESKDLGHIDQVLNGSLTFAPGAGYRYMGGERDFMSYELTTAMTGASWDQSSGSIKIGPAIDTATEYELNYPSVLKIYLYTDVNWVPLDIYLGLDTENQVEGYLVSYDIFDPASGENKTYTTRVSFSGLSGSKVARVLVPWGTQVSLTAICEPGYAVTESYTDQGGECQYIGEDGWFTPTLTPTQEHARGNTSFLTITSSDTAEMIVRVDKIGDPSAPTKDEVINALGGNAVVDCINENITHDSDPWSTPLTADSITIGDIQDKTSVTVTVDPTSYMAGYNQQVASGHDLVEDQVFEYTLTHNGEKWVAADVTQVTINVDCHAKPAPEGPDSALINELVDVNITCTNDDVDHADKTAAYNSLLEGSYLIGDPVLDQATGSYTSDVTIWSARYVQDYNSTKADGIDHDLMAEEQDPQTVTFAWDAENEKWILADGAESTTVSFNVVCETPAPDLPDTPEEISELFEGTPVVVDCVNADVQHSNGKYGILAGSYGWDRNEENPYAAALTVHPTTYVNEYNKTNPGHQLAANSPASQTINFVYDADAQKWTIAENEAKQFVFEVECVTPVPEQPELPTEDELGELFPNGLVIVDCGTEGADHGPEPFSPIADGGYAFIELTGNVDDGATATMRVYPQAYVGAYEALRSNVPHALVEGQTYTDVTLTYTKDAGWTATDFEPIEYIVRCTVCPVDRTPDAPTIPEVNELFVNGAVKVTCVNDKADHGSETYGLKDGYATVGAVEGNESEGWTVDVTVTPGQYVLDFQTAKGAHHTLQPTDQGAQTITLVYTTDGEWALPTAGAQFEYTVICADESTTPGDPGTTPDDPGTTTPDDPGDNQGNTGDNGNQGNNGDQDSTANNGDGSQNANGNNANDKRLPNAGDATNAGLAVAVALGGVAVAGTALVVRKRQQ